MTITQNSFQIFSIGKTWFCAKCQKITNDKYANMQDLVCICTYCSNHQKQERSAEMKLFKMYVDDIICTVRVDPDEYLKFADSFYKNLQFTLKKNNMKGDLTLLVITLKVSSKNSPISGIKNQLTLV